MSQQSNPATLREALAREIADEFCGGSEAVFEAILAKLAASGTHSLPPQDGQHSDLAAQLVQVRATLEKARKFVRGRHSTIPYGPMQLVVEIDIALGLLDAVAMNESASQGLQKASPEGEGREAELQELVRRMEMDAPGKLWGYNTILKYCKSRIAALRQSAPPSGALLKLRDAFCYEVCQSDINGMPHEPACIEATATLAQSAAPSGGEASSMLKEVCEILGVQLGPGLARYAPLIAKVRALAQESKTGAVTETK